eukprot:scaffold1104_cov299-Prasinococcus_capsulatus_cf.AAC.4
MGPEYVPLLVAAQRHQAVRGGGAAQGIGHEEGSEGAAAAAQATGEARLGHHLMDRVMLYQRDYEERMAVLFHELKRGLPPRLLRQVELALLRACPPADARELYGSCAAAPAAAHGCAERVLGMLSHPSPWSVAVSHGIGRVQELVDWHPPTAASPPRRAAVPVDAAAAAAGDATAAAAQTEEERDRTLVGYSFGSLRQACALRNYHLMDRFAHGVAAHSHPECHTRVRLYNPACRCCCRRRRRRRCRCRCWCRCCGAPP